MLSSCQTKTPNTMLDTPTGINIVDNQIILDDVTNATAYVLNIDGEDVVIEDTVFTFNFSGSYEVKYKARAEGYLDSSYSDIYTIVIEEVTSNKSFSYSLQSSFDLLLFEADFDIVYYELTSSDHEIISNDNLVIEFDRSIYLKSSYLLTLDVNDDPYQFTLKTNRGTQETTIKIKDISYPYVYSDLIVSVTDDDLIFKFDFFNSEIISLTMNADINIDDQYVVEADQLIIDKEPFEIAFAADLERSNIMITYQLRDIETGAITIGFLQVLR